MKSCRIIMERAKLTEYLCVKSGNISKAHNLIEPLNKSNECLIELRYFLLMFDVGKRKAILVACYLNNLYGCYASLPTFLIFLNNEKTKTKRNKIILKSTSSTISKSFRKKGKRNSSRFWIRLGHTSSWWDNFYPDQKVSESLRNGKKTSVCLKKVLRNYALS